MDLFVGEGFHFPTSGNCALLTVWVWDLTKTCAKQIVVFSLSRLNSHVNSLKK